MQSRLGIIGKGQNVFFTFLNEWEMKPRNSPWELPGHLFSLQTCYVYSLFPGVNPVGMFDAADLGAQRGSWGVALGLQANHWTTVL